MDFLIGERVFFVDSNKQRVDGTVVGLTTMFVEVSRDDGLKGSGLHGGYTVARCSVCKIDAAETRNGFTVGEHVLCHFTGMVDKPCTITGFKGTMVMVRCDDGYANPVSSEWVTNPSNLKRIEPVAQPEAAVVLGWVPDELDRDKYDQFMRTLGG